MGKSELFSHFADRFEVKRTQAREFFDELTTLSEKELKRAGEFVLPGMVKLVVQKRKARMGRNPATGEAIKIPAKTVVKARIAKQLKDAVLPRKYDFARLRPAGCGVACAVDLAAAAAFGEATVAWPLGPLAAVALAKAAEFLYGAASGRAQPRRSPQGEGEV